MSIQGPFPPSNPYPGLPGGSPQLGDYAEATLWSQLAGAAPTGMNTETQMNAAQQNTFWLLRAYSDAMMLEFATDTLNPLYTPAQAAQVTAGLLKDLNYIQTQVAASNTGFDPAVTAWIQLDIQKGGNLSPGDLAGLMTRFNSVIQGIPGQGFDPNTAYDFRKMMPDDMYNVYLISMISPLLESWRFGQSTPLPTMPDILALTSSGNSTLLASQLPEFFITYFVQRDGLGTPALANDLANFQTLLAPILFIGNVPMSPGLEAVIMGGKDPSGNPFLGLQQVLSMMGPTYSTWPFSTPQPTGNNNTPPPYWDVNPNQPPNWTYSPDWNFLLGNSQALYFYFQSYRHPGTG